VSATIKSCSSADLEINGIYLNSKNEGKTYEIMIPYAYMRGLWEGTSSMYSKVECLQIRIRYIAQWAQNVDATNGLPSTGLKSGSIAFE
jgi:hypothetical protein